MTEYNESYDSEEFTPKVVSFIVAVVVITCVLIPLCTGFASGQNGGDSGPESVTVSNEQYVLSKMAYGDNPTFDITVTNDVFDEMTWIYQNPVLYADNTNVIVRMPNEGEYHIYFDPTSETVGDEPNGLYYSHDKGLGTINRVVSDGQEITVYYTDRSNGDMTYTFTISSPGYYYDPNGEYGCYINPGCFDMLNPEELPSTTYDYLYIPSNYTPHIIWSSNLSWQLAYDRSGIMGMYDTGYSNLHCYYDINDNKITDAGWDMDTRYNGVTTHVHSACYFMILPNTFTYTPGEDDVDDGSFNLKTLYGQSYPWSSVSGGYTSQLWADSLTITNPDFKQMPWETGQTTLDSNFDSAFWSIVESGGGDVGYQLDLLALMEYYSDYAQTFKDIGASIWPDGDGGLPLPVYMVLTNVYQIGSSSNFVDYASPIGIGYGNGVDNNYGIQYGIMPNFPNSSLYPYELEYTSARLIFFSGGGEQNMYIELTYSLGGETYTDTYRYHADAILFLSESETGYLPLGLEGMKEIPLDKMTQYIGVNVNCGAISNASDDSYSVTISMLNVADTIVRNVHNQNDDSIIYPIMYDYTGQFTHYPEYFEYAEDIIFYTSTTEDTLDIDELGWGWYEDGTYITWFDSEQAQEQNLHYLLSSTLGLTIPADESGGGSGSGSGGISGPAGTIILTIPVFGVLGLMMYMLNLFGFVNLTGRFD